MTVQNQFLTHLVRSILKISSILFLFLVSSFAFAGIQEEYEQANTHYQKGEYQQATTLYKALIEGNNLSSDLYYNLGNCYYKQDLIPSAILHYEKALKLEPSHKDALFNLALSNTKTTDKIERVPELFIENTWNQLVTSKTVNTWAYYGVSLIFLALLFFVSYLLANQIIIKKAGFYAGFFFLFCCLFTIFMAAQHNKIINKTSEGIIFTQTVTIKSEPSVSSSKLFTLHEGTKVKLLESVNEWSKIQLPNGNVGWLSSQDIEEI